MATYVPAQSAQPIRRMEEGPAPQEAPASGVSWAAVIAGAFAAASLSLILLALGTGVGLSSISPWSNVGVSAFTVGKGAIAWLILVQIAASAMGGYLAGRLRTKWVKVPTHEVYFRDTAHGFLAWSVSVVLTAAFLASAATSLVAGSNAATAAPTSDNRIDPNAYFVDLLFRTENPTATEPNDALAVRSEASLIFADALRQASMSASDKAYLAHLVSARTGLDESNAEIRVSDVFAQDQQAADQARKATAHFMYWTFLALLIGAFCASFVATMGGRQRDEVVGA